MPKSLAQPRLLAHLLALAGVLLLALAIRIAALDARSLWYDEGYSVMLAQHDAGRIIAQTASLDFNTPLHYLLLHVWTRLAGMSEFSARLLSVFAGVITVALAAPLAILPARCQHRQRAARLSAAMLMALSPMLVSLAQEARMYALLACLFALCVAQLVHSLRTRAWRSWTLWAVWNLAAFLTHVIGGVFFAAQALLVAGWWLWRRRLHRPQSLMPLGATAFAGVGMGMFVLYILSFGRSYGVTYAARLDFFSVVAQSLAAMSLPHLEPRLIAPLAAVGGAGILAALSLAVWRNRGRAMTWVAGVCVTAIVAISAFCAYTGKFGQRYPAVVAPLMLAGAGVTLALWPRRAARPAGSALAVLSAVGLLAWHTDPIYLNEDFRGAAARIRQSIALDETILLVAGHYWPVFAYYYGGDGWHALPKDDVLDVTHALDYASTVPALNRALAGKGGAWLLLWQDDVIDPTRLTQALLARQSIALAPQMDTDEYHGLRLKRYRFFHPYQPLPERLPDTQSAIELTDRQRGLSALGCAQFSNIRSGAGFLEIACFWALEPDNAVPISAQVSLRLTNQAGEQVLQSDQPIVPGGLPYIPYPKPITAIYTIPLPPDLPAGDYSLRAIPYTEVEQISPQVVTPVRVLP